MYFSFYFDCIVHLGTWNIVKFKLFSMLGHKGQSFKRCLFLFILLSSLRSTKGSNLQLGEVKQSFGYGGTAKIAENCVFKNYG